MSVGTKIFFLFCFSNITCFIYHSFSVQLSNQPSIVDGYSMLPYDEGEKKLIAGTMAQLFDACQEECSVIFLWTYLVAAFAVTIWSVVFMWILL